jgi:phospholipid/cholesterol/gamma-HCH transport system substrate-binding protein
MKGASRDFLTGLVALAGLAGLAALLFIFGEVRNVLAKTYEFELRVDQAAGLRPTSDVAMQGVRIGTVVSISNAYEDPQHGVNVRVKVQGDVKIPRNFKLYLDKGFVGDAVLDFQIPPGTSLEASNLIQKGEVLPGTMTVDSLFRRVEEAMAEPLERIGNAADSIGSLSKKAEDFFEHRTVADVEAGKAPNLWSTVQRVDIALAGANKWLGDETIRTDAKEVIAKAKTAIDEVQKTAAAFKETAASLEKTSESARVQLETQGAKIGQATDELSKAMTQTLGKVDQTAGEIQKIAVGINSGDGTLGQLARNPDLYNSIRDAAVRLDKALAELQQIMQKLKDEGIPVNF